VRRGLRRPRRCDGLVQAEEQREIAVDAFLLQHFSGANAFPGGGDFDQDAVAPDTAWSYWAMMAWAWAMVASVS